MKKLFTLSLFATACAVFASEPILISPQHEVPPIKIEKTRSFLYLKMGAADSHPTHTVKLLPGLGIGYRFNAGNSAIDFSANYSGGGGTFGKSATYYYAAPKVNYLRYLSPLDNTSAYAGVGLTWGWLKTKDARKFIGLVPSGTIGYEMNRNADWHSFLQLDVSQPALAARASGDFPGPIAEFSIGAGF